jgi:hypothetical protein
VDATDARQVPRAGKELDPEQGTDYLPHTIIQRFVSRCQGQQNSKNLGAVIAEVPPQSYQRRHRHSYIAYDNTLTRSLYEVDINVHIALSGGIAPEDIPLHRGAESASKLDFVHLRGITNHVNEAFK